MVNEQIQNVAQTVLRDGYFVWESFFSAEECDKAVEEIERVLIESSGKVWEGHLKADQRLFGLERKSSMAEKFLHDPRIVHLLRVLNKNPKSAATILGAKLDALPGNLGSGEGWHRDRSDEDQFKYILYLTDVGLDNGSFEYVLKSHKRLFRVFLKVFHGIGLSATRFPLEIESKKLDNLSTKKFIAQKGTLIIANTRGIHRGAIIKAGQRFAMTVYNWPGETIPSHVQEIMI